MGRELKYKALDYKLQDLSQKEGIVKIRISAYNNIDSFGDVMLPGAFTKTIKEQKQRIKHLLNHDNEYLLGYPIEFIDNPKGLDVVSKMDIFNTGDLTANGIFQKYLFFNEGGRTLEHSIGYFAIKEEEITDKDKDKEINYLKEVMLVEYSTILKWAANEKTPLLSIKSIESQSDFHKLLEKLEELNEKISNISPAKATELIEKNEPTKLVTQNQLNINYLLTNLK